VEINKYISTIINRYHYNSASEKTEIELDNNNDWHELVFPVSKIKTTQEDY